MENKIVDILIEAAKAGGKVLLSYYKTKLTITEKSSKKDLVTQADTESQIIIVNTLKKLMKKNGFSENEIGFIGEENLAQDGKSLFIIDPLDGTSSFVKELPAFAISIAYVTNGQVLAGVIYNPIENLIYIAQKRKGAYLIENNKRTKLIIENKTLSNSLLYFNSNSDPLVAQKVLEKIKNIKPYIANTNNIHSITLSLMSLVQNNAQIVINGRCRLWDIAAAKLIIEEAGGKLTDWSGKEIVYNLRESTSPYAIIGTSSQLIPEVVKYFYE